ncbi:MAG TPA: cadmium resistance transporter [Trichocoleus sp.]|jgi:cadmium resistance transport/sequestration family protein
MTGLISAIITGMTAFAATNIDDVVVLMMLFSQVDHASQSRRIVIGQYLGFALLLLACLPGFIGGMVIPKPWIGLLGFLPIAISIRQLQARSEEEAEIQAVPSSVSTQSPFTRLLHPQIVQVAAITIANGGDNIGIYVPLFASSDLTSLLIILAVFAVLIGVWCYVAYYLASHPKISPLLTRYANRLVPFVLIGLGLYILIESHSYQLIIREP